MRQGELLVMPWGLAAVVSSTAVALPQGNWRAVTNHNYARSYGEMRNKINTLTAQAGLQYTNDVRTPAGVLPIGTTINANGILDPITPDDIWTTLRAYRFVRPVWLVAGDNTNLGSAWIGGAIELLLI